MNCKITFVILISMMLAQSAWPNRHAAVRHIDSADGLSNDFVVKLDIDGQGYVWVATEAGVSRIAGKECQPFQFPGNIDLTEEQISALYCHRSSGKVLIGTETGLVVYDTNYGQACFLDSINGMVRSTINHIAAATNDDVWLVYGNGHVQCFNIATYDVTELNLEKYYNNRCAFDDGRGHLYIGHSQHGMSVVNLSDGSTRHFLHQLGEDAIGLPGNNVRCIFQDDRRRLWIGSDNGLALFNVETGQFTKIALEDERLDDNVYDIVQMNDGTLWVATDMGGIKTLDPDTRAVEDLTVKVSSVNTRSIVQDEFGNIWVGNHSTGVDFVSMRQSDFEFLDYYDNERQLRPVYALAKDSAGGFWMTSADELVKWTDDKLYARWLEQGMTNRRFAFTRCMMVDHAGCVWLGIDDEGVFRFDRKKGQYEKIPIDPEGSDIHSLAETDNGDVWIGGEFGIYLFHEGKAELQETISNVVRNPVTGFLFVDNHLMLMTTFGLGVYLYNLDSGEYQHLSAIDERIFPRVNHVIWDHSHGVWLGTDEGLVYIADPIHLADVSVWGKEQGLTDNHVLALQQDKDGNIWMSTFKGISCFSRTTGKFYNYNYLDMGQSGNFCAGAAISETDGTIYFGSASGACCFNPQTLNGSQSMSDVQIVTSEAYFPAGIDTEIRQLVPDEQSRVFTNYRQNTLHLTFTVRDFSQTDLVEYSYMMKGMDNKWYDIGSDHDVVFRGLRPGRYTFIIRAKLRNQDWDKARQAQLAIVIAPPLWRTWWAYLLYALLLALFAWWLSRSYKRRLALQNTLELEKRESQQKQELNEERLRFFTNITHELRTPLTLILGPLDDLMNDSQLPATPRRRVAMIQKSATRLRDLINEILEFRKTETQNRRLTVARGDIAKFVREICLNYKELYRNPKVQFSYDIADGLPNIYFDSEVITTIMNNFLSNAIKYTDEGSITVTVSRDDHEQISISVRDTGYGIAPEALSHIFQRYYQAKGSHQASGTGIGLALVKALAELHEAQVRVESREGEGSCFVLTLSVDNTYPNALHKEDAPVKMSREEDETAAQDPDILEEMGEGQQPTLLIVEDNADIRQYISDSFGEDFQILQAENGEEGVALAQEHVPDLIVSDIMMPKMNGIELTRQLKEDMRTSHIPIILLTAKDADEDKEEGYDSGADSYLTKPFTAKLLGSRIQNLLAARRRLAERFASESPSVVVRPTAENETGAEVQDTPTSSETPALSKLDQQFFDRLNRLIEENIMQEDLDMAFVTDKMAMSHSAFYRKVKALTGMTAKEYIRKRRLRYCYGLLESGEYNVSQAALMTGFNQMAHFRETFKKEFGILPSEVLKKH